MKDAVSLLYQNPEIMWNKTAKILVERKLFRCRPARIFGVKTYVREIALFDGRVLRPSGIPGYDDRF